MSIGGERTEHGHSRIQEYNKNIHKIPIRVQKTPHNFHKKAESYPTDIQDSNWRVMHIYKTIVVKVRLRHSAEHYKPPS